MSNRKMASLVAVGLAFTAGGHQLALDRNGAHAANTPGQFTPFQAATETGPLSCDTEPSSGCMEALPNIPYPPADLPPSGQSFCHATGESDGASGSVCLFMGNW